MDETQSYSFRADLARYLNEEENKKLEGTMWHSIKAVYVQSLFSLVTNHWMREYSVPNELADDHAAICNSLADVRSNSW